MRKLVLDPGHGGNDARAGSSPIGVRGPAGTREKDVTLALARRLRGHLEPTIRVEMTRDGDSNLPLTERAGLARQGGADLFLSLHANGGLPGRRGPETWIHPAASPSSRAFGARVQRALGRLSGPSRGVKVGDLAVIDPAVLGGVDACLVEVDFLSEPAGERRLREPASLDRIARALAGAVGGHLAGARYGRGPRATSLATPAVAPSPCDHRYELTKADLPPDLALVKSHLGPVASDKVSLILRANSIPDDASEVDVVVHFHGYSPDGAAMSLLDKEAFSGLDFCDPEAPSNPYTWRERPTLAILPLGRFDGGRTYSFPAFASAAGLESLIDFSLQYFASQLGRESLSRARLILTAHSGGGAALMSGLGHTDADEAHAFDATYNTATNLIAWMRKRITADAGRLRGGGDDPTALMRDGGSAMRVAYLAGTKTAAQAEASHRALVSALAAVSDVAYALCPWYRVEHNTAERPALNHDEMPRRLGWQWLYSAGADVVPALARPAPPVPCDPPATSAPSEGEGSNGADSDAEASPEVSAAGRAVALEDDPSVIVDSYLSQIEAFEQALDAGRIPRLVALAPEFLDSTAYEAAGRDDEYEDHRARLDGVVARVNEWALDTTQSAIGQIQDPTSRAHLLDEVEWSRQGFPGNKEGPEGETLRLFAAMAGLVPERRVPRLAYHDVEGAVVKVDGQSGHRLYPPAANSFEAMHDTAAVDGVDLRIRDSFRSQKRQEEIKKSQPNPGAVAQKRSAHTYGLAIDLAMSVEGLSFTEINTHSMSNLMGMYRSPVYKWMYANAERYGFYPYSWEPWHWEYNPPGFKEEFERKAYGRARGPARRRPSRARTVGSFALDDRSQPEQQQAVLEDAARSLIAAERTRYDQVHFDSGRVNFGIGSWTGGHIPELLDFYRMLAEENGLENQLDAHFVMPGRPDGRANFDDIRARFARSGAATVLNAAEQAAFRALGGDTDLRAAQDRKLASDVKQAVEHITDDNVYPFIDGYMAAFSELAAIVIVHATHQHGQSRDLIRAVVRKRGGEAAVGQAMVDGTLTEEAFLRDVAQEVIDRVRPDLKQGVRNRYDKLFSDFATSDTSYFYDPQVAQTQAYRPAAHA